MTKSTLPTALTISFVIISCAPRQGTAAASAAQCGGEWRVEVNNPFLYPVTAAQFVPGQSEAREIGTVPPDNRAVFHVYWDERPLMGYMTEDGIGHRLQEPGAGRIQPRDRSVADRLIGEDRYSSEQVRIKIECWRD